MKSIINYVGWIGHGNLGDEALYKVNKEVFKPYNFKQDLTTLKNLNKYLRLLTKRNVYNSSLFQKLNNWFLPVTLFGGGTVIPEWLKWVKPNKINYAYGVGVRNPEFWGKYPQPVIEKVKQFNFRMLGVRGRTSMEILKGWGIKCEEIGDPCLLLKPIKGIERKSRRIAINVGSDGITWGDEVVVFNETGKICKALKNHSYQPVLIPFCKSDVDSVTAIAEYTNTPIFRGWMDVEKTINFIASCHALIGERLHASVFSAATYTPFITLEYRPKCRDFTESLGFKEYIIRTDDITCEKTLKMLYLLEENWYTLHKSLFKKVNFYRGKLRWYAEKIKKDLHEIYAR